MRFLVDSQGRLGDLAINIALFRAIARHGHHLEVVLDATNAELLDACTFIARVHPKPKGWLGQAHICWQLARQSWDAILLLRRTPRVKLLGILGRAEVRCTWRQMDPQLYSEGVLLFRLSILDGLIDDWCDPIETALPFKAEDNEIVRRKAGMCKGETYLTVAPGAYRPAKRWALSSFSKVIRQVRSRFTHVLVVGSAQEQHLCKELAAEADATNLAGKLTLTETCVLVSGATQHLGNCSGLGHVAACNGAAVVSVGGHRHYRPWRQNQLPGKVDSITPAQVLEVLGTGKSPQ